MAHHTHPKAIIISFFKTNHRKSKSFFFFFTLVFFLFFFLELFFHINCPTRSFPFSIFRLVPMNVRLQLMLLTGIFVIVW